MSAAPCCPPQAEPAAPPRATDLVRDGLARLARRLRARPGVGDAGRLADQSDRVLRDLGLTRPGGGQGDAPF